LCFGAEQVDTECSVVEPSHRAQLLPVLTRLLYAKIVQRKVVGVKAGLPQRRSHVLAWFAGMRDEELDELMSIVLAPFQHKGGIAVVGVPPKKLLGFMNTLGDLVGQLGHLLERHMAVLLELLLHIVRFVFADQDEEELKEGEEPADSDGMGNSEPREEGQGDVKDSAGEAKAVTDGQEDDEDGQQDEDEENQDKGGKSSTRNAEEEEDGCEDEDERDVKGDDQLDNKQVYARMVASGHFASGFQSLYAEMPSDISHCTFQWPLWLCFTNIFKNARHMHPLSSFSRGRDSNMMVVRR